MLYRFLKAAWFPAGAVVFVAIFLLLGFNPRHSLRLLYLGVFGAILLGLTLLVAMLITVPGVRRWLKSVRVFLKREKGFVLACMGLLAVALLGLLLFLEGHNEYLTRHRTELFIMVVLPSVIASPLLVGTILYRIKEWRRSP